MQGIGCDGSPCQSPGQRPREHPVRLLALRVGCRSVVTPPLEIHVVEIQSVRHHGGGVDHAPSRSAPQQFEKLSSERVISQHVCREGEFDALGSLPPLGRRRTGIVDQDIQRVMFSRKFLGSGTNRTLARQIYDEQFNIGTAGLCRDGIPCSLALRAVPARENDAAAAMCEPPRNLESDPSVRSGDQTQRPTNGGVVRGGQITSNLQRIHRSVSARARPGKMYSDPAIPKTAAKRMSRFSLS